MPVFNSRSFLKYSFTCIVFGFGTLCAQTIAIGPYLQDAEPNSINIMWETSSGDESTVEWGTTSALGNTATGTAVTGSILSRVHDTKITGLTPNTRYYYKVVTGSAQSPIYDFITPPLPSSEASFNIVSMSDMQQDWEHPNVFSDMINQQLIPFVNTRYGNDLATDLAYVFIPGDLVVVGGLYPSWESTFFDPAEDLFHHVPVYPVAGNHEGNSPNYFRYFHLPENGTNQNDYLEHWWYKDYSNVRLIGLESNAGYRIQTQLDWLQTVLSDASNNPYIDFVFAQLHHPHESELWIAGNIDYTGDVITILEDFSTASGKPSIHFFGHTHGYSRGQSRDHTHLMVNVATAGGAIDNWGEFAQQDYKEFSRSDDDYGFVLVEVEAGADPQFLLTRVSHGSYEDGLVDNVTKDTVRIRMNNVKPVKPTGLFPYEGAQLTPDCIVFLGSDFVDGDGGLHGATQWQIATDNSFFNIIYDEWYQHENWYYDVDLEAGNNMVDQEVLTLLPSTNYFWRVRYRDRNLGWSDYSNTIAFSTLQSSLSPNLLLNGGAEDGTTNWVEVSGSFESIASGECAGNNAFIGSRLFAVGGVCNANSYAEGHQDIDVSSYAALIDTDSSQVHFGGYLSDYNGSDLPEFRVEFYDEFGGAIGTSIMYGNQSSAWTYMNETEPIPAGTRTVRMILTGTRFAGIDNDSYFDEMFVRINSSTVNCEQASAGLPTEQTQTPQLLIYPNPTRDAIIIEAPDQFLGAAFTLTGRSGKVVQQGVLKKNKEKIDYRWLEEGIYFMHVEGMTHKLIKL